MAEKTPFWTNFFRFTYKPENGGPEQQISVADYFAQKYGYTVKYPGLPTVVIARSVSEAKKAIEAKNGIFSRADHNRSMI